MRSHGTRLATLKPKVVHKVHSRSSGCKIVNGNVRAKRARAAPGSMRSTLPQLKLPAFLRSQAAHRYGQESFSAEDMKDLCAASRAASCDIARNITRTITHSLARNIKPQHHAREKLTGEIVKHDAKLARQNLRLSRHRRVYDLIRWERRQCLRNVFLCFWATCRQVGRKTIWGLLPG